jgi:hypothetical protein
MSKTTISMLEQAIMKMLALQAVIIDLMDDPEEVKRWLYILENKEGSPDAEDKSEDT